MSETLSTEALMAQVYAAADEARHWPKTLGALGGALGADGGVLYVVDVPSGLTTFWSSAKLDRAHLQAIRERYRPLEFLTRIRTEFGRDQALTRGRVLADDEFEKSALYTEILKAARIWHVLGGVVAGDKATVAALGFYRPREKDVFTDAEIERFRAFAPHVGADVRLQQKIAALELRLGDTAEVLDRLPLGVLLVDGRGRIVTMNRIARQIVSQNDGLRADAARVCRADVPAERERLAHLIASAANRESVKGAPPGGAVKLTRPSGKRALSVLVAPLTGTGQAAGSRRAAILYVHDPESRRGTPVRVLADAYGLTASEARLLGALLDGKRLEDAAAQFGVSLNTVKTHLQNVFRKTDTTRQSELLSLVLTGPATLADREAS